MVISTIFYKAGLVFTPPPSSNEFVASPELLKVHRTFMHPSTGKLYNLPKRAYNKQTNDKIRRILQDIADNCDQCSDDSVPPFRFHASIPKYDVMFNRELPIDLMWLNGRPVIHVMDTETKSRNGIVIQDIKSEGLWNDFAN